MLSPEELSAKAKTIMPTIGYRWSNGAEPELRQFAHDVFVTLSEELLERHRTAEKQISPFQFGGLLSVKYGFPTLSGIFDQAAAWSINGWYIKPDLVFVNKFLDDILVVPEPEPVQCIGCELNKPYSHAAHTCTLDFGVY